MKPSGYSLKITSPCTEDWSRMTPDEQGKFCSLCSKTVTDITHLTDAEIHTLLNNSTGNQCVRGNSEQFNRPLELGGLQPRFPHFYKMLAGLLMVSAAGTTITHAQVTYPAEQRQNAEGVKKEVLCNPVSTDEIYRVQKSITGKVLDAETHLPVADAMVYIQDIRLYSLSDSNGCFSLSLPDTCMLERITLKVIEIEHVPLDIQWNRNRELGPLQVYLNPAQVYIMGEMIEVHHRKWYQHSLRSLYRMGRYKMHRVFEI